MKVALITNYWKNSNGGGIKIYMINLVEALKEIGVDVRVLFREGNDPEHFSGGKNKLAFCLACYKRLRKISPDVIHSQGSWYCLLPGVVYKKLHGCTLVHTFHTEPEKKLPIPAKLFFQSLLKTCNCVTFVSKRLEERISEVDNFSFPRTVITYAGVEPHDVSDEEIKHFYDQYGIKKNATIFLALGMTALSYKAEGLKLLILTLKEVRAKYPNIVLLATRDGKYLSDLKNFAYIEGLEDIIIFTGDVENPYVPLALCDIYTHISMGEGGLSIALLEAMSMGKSIIASSVGGIPEAIEDGKNGFLVEPSAEKIAEKIYYLLQDKKKSEYLGRNARKTVQEKFTWKITACVFINIYIKHLENSHQYDCHEGHLNLS